MNKHLRSMLMLGVAAGAMATFSSAAFAFDTVNWKWDQKISDDIDRTTTITSDFDPTGIVDIEKLQVFVGDVTATSTVSGVHNNPVFAGNGTVSFTVDWSGTEDDNPNPSVFGTGILGGPQATLSGDLSGSGDISGTVDEGTDAVGLTATFNDIPVEVGEIVPLDAETELPSVVSAATAVANNQSISSDVSVSLHDAQFAFGGFGGGEIVGLNNNNNNDHDNDHGNDHGDDHGNDHGDSGGNSNLSLAMELLSAAADGNIIPANVTATSDVSDILNASVDSSATAVANNLNVDLAARTDGDSVLLGDITQVAFADVSASSTVNNVSVSNYSNLAAINPLVNSTATAVGNNVSIKVGPAVVVTP